MSSRVTRSRSRRFRASEEAGAASPLIALPEEVLHLVARALLADDLLAASAACRSLREATIRDDLWEALTDRLVPHEAVTLEPVSALPARLVPVRRHFRLRSPELQQLRFRPHGNSDGVHYHSNMVCSDNGLRATTREPDGDHEMVLCIPAALLPLELTLRMPDDQGFEDALEFHARDGRATSGVGWLDVIPCDVRSGGEYTFRFQRCRTAAVCRCRRPPPRRCRPPGLASVCLLQPSRPAAGATSCRCQRTSWPRSSSSSGAPLPYLLPANHPQVLTLPPAPPGTGIPSTTASIPPCARRTAWSACGSASTWG